MRYYSQSTEKMKMVYIAPSLSSFISSDISALKEHYQVRVLTGRWDKKHLTLWLMIKQAFVLMFLHRQSKFILISFAGYWSVLPVLIGKMKRIPVYIILNGTDCASIPSINYGSLRKPILKRAIRLSMTYASKLLPVSSSLRRVENSFYDTNPKERLQGYLSFFPELKTQSQVIPNGFDFDFWSKKPEIDKEKKSFIAVFSCQQFYLKGGDLIVRLAELRPDLTFYIAGCDKAPAEYVIPANVKLLGKVTKEILKEYYSRSKYVLQLSIFEGFGCALCEAMLCECTPIVSSVNALPEIVGSKENIVEKREVKRVLEIVENLLEEELTHLSGSDFRTSIMDRFSMEQRIGLIKESFEQYYS